MLVAILFISVGLIVLGAVFGISWLRRRADTAAKHTWQAQYYANERKYIAQQMENGLRERPVGFDPRNVTKMGDR